MTARHVLEDTKGLTGGHWQAHGVGPARWVPDPPRPRAPRDQRTRLCAACRVARVRPASQLCATCRQAVTHLRPITTPGRPVCVCGCLLARSDTRCPACNREGIAA